MTVRLRNIRGVRYDLARIVLILQNNENALLTIMENDEGLFDEIKHHVGFLADTFDDITDDNNLSQ